MTKKVPAKQGEAKIRQVLKKMDKTEKEAACRIKIFKIKSINIFSVHKYVQLTATIQL